MENASRALIIAGAIFIGILILSLWVYFYANLSGSTTAVLNRNQNIEVTSFNNTLLMVNGADGKLKRGENTYIGDLITVIHYAQNQNLLAQRQVNDGEKLVDITIITPEGRYTLDSLFDTRYGRKTKISKNYKKLIQDTTINVQENVPLLRAVVKIDLNSIKTADDGRIRKITYIVKYESM